MTEYSKKRAKSKPFATDSISAQRLQDARGAGGELRTRWFHDAMGLPNRSNWNYQPTVDERLLRGKLLLEEVLETLTAMGLTLCIDGAMANQAFVEITVAHVEGARYDPIETADGLGDIKVICNGTAAQFGIPQEDVDLEIWASNMTKLDADGQPIVNRCKICAPEPCDGNMHSEEMNLIDPTQPVGKILKPETYVPANIARLFYESTEG